MKTVLAFGFAILVFYASGQSPLRANVGRDYVLFIYADAFTQAAWAPLPTVEKEVEALQGELQANYGFTVLPALKNPGKAQAITRLEELAVAGTFKQGDQLLVYISTHGYINKDKTSGGLVFQDGKFYRDDPAETTLLPYRQLRDLFEKIPCNHKLLVLDACYSGIFGKEFKTEPDSLRWPEIPACADQVREALRGKSYLYFTSVGQNDRSASESVFAMRFLDRLREQDDDGIISYYELYAKLLRSVQPRPNSGEFDKHSKGSDFVFVRNKVCTPEGLLGFLPCTERPALTPANFVQDAHFDRHFKEARDAELSAVAPRLEGGYAAFGYGKSIAGKQAAGLGPGGGEDMLLALMHHRSNEVDLLLSLGGKGDERALSGLQTHDGGYVLAGFTDSESPDKIGKKDAYVVKLDAGGNYRWHCRSGSSGEDWFQKIVELGDGTLVAAGTSEGKPFLVKISALGALTKLSLPTVKQGSEVEITALIRTPYDDILLGGNARSKRSSQAFFLRFSAERSERIGNIHFIETTNDEAQLADLHWTAQGQLLALCTEKTEKGQENAFVYRFEERGLELAQVQQAISVGGNAPDFAAALCSDGFGYTYLTGRGKSYKQAGGIYDRLFLYEMNPEGNGTAAAPGWQGSVKGSKGNALAMLPGRRLLVGGQDDAGTAVLKIFHLSAPENPQAELFFDRQANLFFDGEKPDGRLGAREHAWFRLRVENKCGFVAGAYIEVEVENEGHIKCPRNLYLDDMPALSGQTVSLPLEGLDGIKPGQSTRITLTLVAGGNTMGQPESITINH